MNQLRVDSESVCVGHIYLMSVQWPFIQWGTFFHFEVHFWGMARKKELTSFTRHHSSSKTSSTPLRPQRARAQLRAAHCGRHGPKDVLLTGHACTLYLFLFIGIPQVLYGDIVSLLFLNTTILGRIITGTCWFIVLTAVCMCPLVLFTVLVAACTQGLSCNF